MLLQRVLSAAVLIPIVLLATYQGGIWFLLLVAMAALLSAYEYLQLLKLGEYRPVFALVLPLVLLFLLDSYWPGYRIAGGSLAIVGMLLMTWQVFRANAPLSMVSWALNLAGAVYIGWGASHFIALRNLKDGLYWIALTFAITWVCDSAAYFVGCNLGRHPFFPKISPKKTREGAIGGLLGGTAASLVAGTFMGLPLFHSLLLGLTGSLASTFGDLSESVIKRQVGVKDSSHLIPGHGGMLDRIDSLLFNVVVVYYYAYWILGIR